MIQFKAKQRSSWKRNVARLPSSLAAEHGSRLHPPMRTQAGRAPAPRSQPRSTSPSTLNVRPTVGIDNVSFAGNLSLPFS